jgi:hypothetical protein
MRRVWPFWIFMVVLIAVITAGVTWSHRRDKERAKGWQSAAQRLGWDYADKLKLNVDFVRRGKKKRGLREFQNVITGEHLGVQIAIFERATGGYDSYTWLSFVRAGLEASYPNVAVQHFTGRRARSTSGPEIEIGSDQFRSAYHVLTEHAAFATALLQEDVQKTLLAVPTRPPRLEVSGSTLTIGEGRRLDPALAEQRVELVVYLARQIASLTSWSRPAGSPVTSLVS